MTADISCLAHFQPVEPLPPCQTMSITTTYKGDGETIDCKEVIITESGSVSQVIFTGQVKNEGIISNSTIAAKATVTDGTLTGTIKNEGTIKNIKFVGVKLSGGKLIGTIQNSTQIGSVIADVELLPPTILSGGLLSGQIRADSTSLIQDVQLKAGLKLTGGQLDGTIQGDPVEIAQIMADRILSTAQLSYVCLSPSVQLPLVLDNVIGEGVTFQIPQLNNQCLSKVDPSTFTVDQIEQFPPVAFLAMDAKSLRKFSPMAIAALTTEQFQHLPPPALNGLTTNQLRELPVAILNKIFPQQLTAINRNEFQGLSDTELGRILVYLNADNISPAEVKPLLPKGWDIDSSGALTAPVGTQLTLRDLPPPAKLPSNVTLPPQPDFQTSFALGGKGKTTTIANLNQVLTATNINPNLKSYQNLTMSQNPQGIVEVSGPSDRKNRYAFMGDKDHMLQVLDEETLAGLKRDTGGFYLINTSEDQQYRLLPAPINIVDLANLLEGGEVVLRESGEVLMTLPDKSVIVALFDPEVTPVTGSINPRLQLPTTSQVKKREPEVGWVYYSDGTKQAFRPTVLSPPTFIDTGLKFNNQVESVNLVAN
jgi:cytoskeletal protein CcmA (bactofilin family)